MARHGHARSDARNLHLHRVALEHLRASPELRLKAREILERWLASPDTAPSSPWRLEWREMLADWPFERIAETVLDPVAGQTLRQCSPLGPALTPRERRSALRDAQHEIQLTGA